MSILRNRQKAGGPAPASRAEARLAARAGPPNPPANDVPDPAATDSLTGSSNGRAGYRYRTAALVGPWRARPDQAQGDAVRARQAAFDDDQGFVWAVAGSIEIDSRLGEGGADPGGWSAH